MKILKLIIKWDETMRRQLISISLRNHGTSSWVLLQHLANATSTTTSTIWLYLLTECIQVFLLEEYFWSQTIDMKRYNMCMTIDNYVQICIASYFVSSGIPPLVRSRDIWFRLHSSKITIFEAGNTLGISNAYQDLYR